jgi:GPI mannosyltransferase 3
MKFWLIIGFSLLLRLIFINFSHHLYYPDELHQSLEIAHKLVTGLGYVPWEYQYGLRSYIFPLTLSLPIKLSYALGITNPAIMHLFPESLLIILSLAIPIAVYYLVKHLLIYQPSHRLTAILPNLAFFTAVGWYELIYFSPRGLTEVFTTSLLAICLIIILRQPKYKHLASFLVTISILIRPQFFPLIFPLMYWQIKLFTLPKFLPGFLLGIVIFGGTDLYFYGSFASSLITNIKLSFLSGVSSEFGRQPWWYYLAQLSVASSGLWVLSLINFKNRQALMVLISAIALILLHSFIPHKEYRFIFPVIPIFISLFFSSINRLLIGFLPLLISGLGIIQFLPYQSWLYGQPLLLKDPHLDLYQTLAANPNICGIYDPHRLWVYSGGHYHLNRDIPIYSSSNPPPNANNINLLITETNQADYAGLSKLHHTSSYSLFVDGKKLIHPGYTAYYRAGDCTPDPNYTSYRNFANIDEILKSNQAVKTNKLW